MNSRYHRTASRLVPVSLPVLTLVLLLAAVGGGSLPGMSGVLADGFDGPSIDHPVQTEGADYVMLDAGDLKLVVGFQLARKDRDHRGFVPLVVSILNLRHKLVRVRKDEFHLYGEDGVELPMASLKQVRSQYGHYRQDAHILITSGFVQSLPYAGDYRPTNFYPTPGFVGIYAVTLDFKQNLIDLLYFKGDYRQRLRLMVEESKSHPALEVSFTISRGV